MYDAQYGGTVSAKGTESSICNAWRSGRNLSETRRIFGRRPRDLRMSFVNFHPPKCPAVHVVFTVRTTLARFSAPEKRAFPCPRDKNYEIAAPSETTCEKSRKLSILTTINKSRAGGFAPPFLDT